MFAANGNHVGCAKLLLAAGADKDATDEDGDTALSIAASVGHEEVVQLLTTADVRW
jgi:ankyrin repeat protein